MNMTQDTGWSWWTDPRPIADVHLALKNDCLGYALSAVEAFIRARGGLNQGWTGSFGKLQAHFASQLKEILIHAAPASGGQ